MRYAVEEICRPGRHVVTEPIRLYSGTHIKGEPGAVITGGMEITCFEKQENGVYVADLSKQGITMQPITARAGWGRPSAPGHSELFINGKCMNLSRYPRNDFITISEIVEPVENEQWKFTMGKREAGFYFQDERPKSWVPNSDLWVYGYWQWDWCSSYEHVAELDADRGFIRTSEPYAIMDFRPGNRFCFYNVPEEVTEAGDYCLDYANNRVYFLPPDGEEPRDVVISLVNKPVFVAEDAHDIVIEGLAFEHYCGNLMEFSRVTDLTLRDLRIRYLGESAVLLDHGRNITVENCSLHHVAASGFMFSHVGDRRTLESGNCVFRGNHMYHVGDWLKCYKNPINILHSVGVLIEDNCIHDCPHSAILWGGNEFTIRNNTVYNVVTETGDAGAIYAGRDFTFRGNVIEGNFIHHLGGYGVGSMAIYNDDCLSGTMMRNNIFYKAGRAAYMGGGRDFIVRGNVFIDCYPAVELDGRGIDDHPVWRASCTRKGELYRHFAHISGSGVSGADELYQSRYPELKDIKDRYASAKDDDESVDFPPSAVIADNVFCSERAIEYTRSAKSHMGMEYGNRYVSRGELEKYMSCDGYRRFLEIEDK